MRATEIFVEDFPIIGKVPMTFYLPPSKEKSDMKILIEKHGGVVSDLLHECHSYQVKPIGELVPRVQYF